MPNAPTIFDRSLLRVRKERALRLGPATFLIDRVADDLVERLSAVTRTFTHAADIATPGEGLGRALTASGKVADVSTVDFEGEAERLPFAEGSLDLAVSALALQLVNDLPGALAQIRRALKPDG